MDVQDRLEIKVLEARGLEYQGSKPNTYVQLRVGFDFRNTNVIQESDVPKWRTKPFIFNSILASQCDTVLVNIYHRDSFQRKDVDLGMICLPLDTYLSSPKVEFRYFLFFFLFSFFKKN